MGQHAGGTREPEHPHHVSRPTAEALGLLIRMMFVMVTAVNPVLERLKTLRRSFNIWPPLHRTPGRLRYLTHAPLLSDLFPQTVR